MSVMVDFHMVVNWRWSRVKELDEAGASASRSVDDKWIKRACRYQKKRKQHHVGTDIKLRQAFPAIHLAHELNMNPLAHFRWIIEAAVLADVDRAWLTKFLALPEGVVEAYEMLFFDVRQTLIESRGYVAATLISPIMAAGVDATDPDGFWKILAFNGGWAHVMGCWCAGQASKEAMTYYKSVVIQQTLVKSAGGVLGVKPNSFNAVDLVRAGIERVQYEEERGQGAREDKQSQAMEVLVGSINVVVQDARIKLPAEELRLRLPDASDIYSDRRQAQQQQAAVAKAEGAKAEGAKDD